MLKEYYRGRGWDEEGVPNPKKLAELKLANL
jgi:aldehyde:ferredoxin oxidoreductase